MESNEDDRSKPTPTEEATPNPEEVTDPADDDSQRYSVSLGSLAIQGPIDRKLARRVFQRHKRSLDACAHKAASRGDDPRGTLALRLHLMDKVKPVPAVLVEDDKTGTHGRLAHCVQQQLRNWSWPTNYVCGAAVMHVQLRVR